MGLCILLLFISPVSCFSNFSQAKQLIYKIKEGLPTRTLIGAIGADLKLDFAVDPPLLFSLVLNMICEHYISLNNRTGELYTSHRQIDRETLCLQLSDGQDCFLALDVFILPQQYFQLIKIKILVEDINDNKPNFPIEEIHLFVPENAQLNSRFAVEQSAVDPDSNINGIQTYWLTNNYGIFTLDVEENGGGEMTPFLIVTGSLDREAMSVYTTSIIAEDGGSPPLSGTATLKIFITDVNDNCPKFTESQINITMYANFSIGTHIASLHAHDPDLGENGKITYVYSDRVPRSLRAIFNLDKVTGVIKLASKLDINTSKHYMLSVLAVGPGCISAVAKVSLHVISLVSAPPVVIPRYIAAEKDGIVSLKESEPPPSPIAFFTIKNTEQQEVDCHLEGDDSLDHEEIQEYKLTVVANNSLGVVIRTFVKVQVLDENDNTPVFEKSNVDLFIKENNSPNAFLTKLHANDKDSGDRGKVLYLLELDVPSVFTLDRVTGVLLASMSLDREEKEKYSFKVRAMDCGSPRRETFATVTVTVLDKNDNSPRFINKDFTFFIPENFPNLGEIGVLSVSDADSGRNGFVALSIVNGSDIFVIDTGKGVLRARTPLDREQQGTYYLWVEATDGGEPSLSTVTIVTIILLDVNDNAPVVLFPQSNQSYLLVLPTTLPGTSITEVYAVDKDTGMNAVIVYSIIKRKGGEPGSFDIDPKTGNITLKKTLNYRGLYSLLVKVSDHGQPDPLSSMVMVNFFVNETVTNESYVHSLLTKDAEMETEHILAKLMEAPIRNEGFPCLPVLIAAAAACLGLLLTVFSLAVWICSKKQEKKQMQVKKLEVEIPLKMNSDRKQMDTSEI
uniref:Protocadherin-20 n=1 Tax=Paramormyrops kingsleyae TaxID=1676925 RepID=A0A3B3S8K6_9TELE